MKPFDPGPSVSDPRDQGNLESGSQEGRSRVICSVPAGSGRSNDRCARLANKVVFPHGSCRGGWHLTPLYSNSTQTHNFEHFRDLGTYLNHVPKARILEAMRELPRRVDLVARNGEDHPEIKQTPL